MLGKLESAAPLAAVALVGVVGFYVWKKGGIAPAAQAAGAAVVEAATGAATGAATAVVTPVSEAVGLPTPADTTTDPAVARWIIDNFGTFEASRWSGAGALFKAMLMPAGSGTPPPPNSPAGRNFSSHFVDTGDETARLLARYPAYYGQPSP